MNLDEVTSFIQIHYFNARTRSSPRELTDVYPSLGVRVSVQLIEVQFNGAARAADGGKNLIKSL